MSVCFPKHQNGLFFPLEDSVLKDLPACLNSLFRATFRGIPLLSFLNRRRSAHLKSRACTLLLCFLAAPRILNSAASWSLQPRLSLLCLWIADPAVCHPSVGHPVPLPRSYLTLQKSPGLLLSLPREVKEIKVFPKNQGLRYRDCLKLLREDLTLFLTLMGWFVPNSSHLVSLSGLSPSEGWKVCEGKVVGYWEISSSELLALQETSRLRSWWVYELATGGLAKQWAGKRCL